MVETTNYVLEEEIVPFDDFYMTYSTKTHRYTLTVNGFDELYNANLATYAGSKENAEALLEELSADYYKWVYKYYRRDEKHRRVNEYLMCKHPDLRDSIQNGMSDYMRATVRNGWLLTKDLNPVNMETGVVLDFSNVPGIAPDAIDTIITTGILSRGGYTFSISDEYYRIDY